MANFNDMQMIFIDKNAENAPPTGGIDCTSPMELGRQIHASTQETH